MDEGERVGSVHEDHTTRLMPDLPEQPGPKWLSLSPRDQRKWQDKQWTEPDSDYDGPPLVRPPKPPWRQTELGYYGFCGIITIAGAVAMWLLGLPEYELTRGLGFAAIGFVLGHMTRRREHKTQINRLHDQLSRNTCTRVCLRRQPRHPSQPAQGKPTRQTVEQA